MFCKGGRLALAGLLVWEMGCGARQRRPVERLAILTFENLSGKAEAGWVGQATARVIASQLEGLPNLYAFHADTLREARLARATRALHGYYSLEAGKLRVAAQLEELGDGRCLLQEVVVHSPDGLLAASGELARKLDGRARAYRTASQMAVRAYIEGMQAPDPKAARAAFQRAVAADADYGDAYVSWAQTMAGRRLGQEAREAIEQAAGRGRALGEIPRAELEVVEASLRGDRDGYLSAAAKLLRLTPANSDLARSLAEGEFQARRFAAAVEHYRQAARLEPEAPEVWNSLGYGLAFAGDLAGARESLREYQRLNPGSANPHDSMGEVALMFGDLAAAEKSFLECHRVSPGFLGGAPLMKAAWARLWRGDPKGADELASKYIEQGKERGDRRGDLRQARWDYVRGRRSKAAERLKGVAEGAASETATEALAQLSIWRLSEGDREQARRLAAEAQRKAVTPRAAALAALCGFVSLPPAPAGEWAARAAKAFAQPARQGVRKHALAYALLLDRHFREAAPYWKEIWEQTRPSDSGLAQVLLAWALAESSQTKEAAALLARFPIPEAGAEPTFEFLMHPRFVELRARVLGPAAK